MSKLFAFGFWQRYIDTKFITQRRIISDGKLGTAESFCRGFGKCRNEACSLWHSKGFIWISVPAGGFRARLLEVGIYRWILDGPTMDKHDACLITDVQKPKCRLIQLVPQMALLGYSCNTWVRLSFGREQGVVSVLRKCGTPCIDSPSMRQCVSVYVIINIMIYSSFHQNQSVMQNLRGMIIYTRHGCLLYPVNLHYYIICIPYDCWCF